MSTSFHQPLAALLLWVCAWPGCAHAAARLNCDVTYAGITQTLETSAVMNPYVVPSVDIGGRFWFKAVMVGQDVRVDYIKIYVYLDTRAQPVLVNEGVYLAPFQTGTAPYRLTGTQHVFAGPVERELIYHCTLQGAQP